MFFNLFKACVPIFEWMFNFFPANRMEENSDSDSSSSSSPSSISSRELEERSPVRKRASTRARRSQRRSVQRPTGDSANAEQSTTSKRQRRSPPVRQQQEIPEELNQRILGN